MAQSNHNQPAVQIGLTILVGGQVVTDVQAAQHRPEESDFGPAAADLLEDRRLGDTGPSDPDPLPPITGARTREELIAAENARAAAISEVEGFIAQFEASAIDRADDFSPDDAEVAAQSREYTRLLRWMLLNTDAEYWTNIERPISYKENMTRFLGNQAQRMDGQEPRLLVSVKRHPPSSVPRFLGKSARGEKLRGADLSGQDLSNIDFSYADLRGANLSGCDLTGCRFYRTRLDGAKLAWRVIDAAAIDSTCQPVPPPLLVPCRRS